MTDKLISLVDKMLDFQDKIVNTARRGDEFYFEFPEGVFWSVKGWFNHDAEEYVYSLYMYPKYKGTIEKLTKEEWNRPFGDSEDYISYNTLDIKHEGFKQKLTILHRVIQSKALGADKIIDQIIEGN